MVQDVTLTCCRQYGHAGVENAVLFLQTSEKGPFCVFLASYLQVQLLPLMLLFG